jgi:monovalent cation:H+ antiporter-2, CPA2 family
MGETAHTLAYADALVILVAAGIVIPAFARLRISPVIGFILVGIAVGPFGLAAITDAPPWLHLMTISDPARIAPMAELGIIMLLFGIGLELSFGRLWRMRKRLFGFGAAELVGAAALIAGVLMAMGERLAPAFGLGIALSLSSTALVLPIAGTQSRVGQLALSMLLFEDLALVPIIFVLGAIAPAASAAGPESLLRVIVIGAGLVAAMLVAGRFVLPPLFAQAARTKSPELFLSASLVVAILASLATVAVGLSPIVGALVAGLLIAETSYHDEVEAVTKPFRGLALGVFLISVGMGLDLNLFAARWPQILLAVAGVVVIKALVTMLLLRTGRINRGLAIETGVLMASPSETTLIVLGTAAAGGLISRETAAFWQVVTAIGLTITPLLAWLGHNAAIRAEWRQDGVEPVEETAEPQTIVIGFGRVGRMVAEMLENHGRNWVAIEADADLVTLARRDGKPVRFGDAGRMATLETLGIAKANAVVMTMDDPQQILKITGRLRKAYPDLTIIARARDVAHAAELYRAGVSDAVPETLESSLQLSEAVLIDLGVAMGPVIASIHEKRDALRAEIMASAELTELPRLGPLKRQAE